MMCYHCETEVQYVVPITKQLYDEDNIEAGVSTEHWCLNCINNIDSDGDLNIGIPRTK
jgi:hypothetical protein